MKRCSVAGCEGKHMARELCQRHYNHVYHATVRKGSIKNHGSVYPQALVRIPVPGWGFRA
jgi:hypothetical protein